MAPFDFWRWTTEEDLNKQRADDFIERARQRREEADRAELQQHVGGLIENFQADIARRMEPLTSAFNRPSPQPEPQRASPVDEIMSRFGGAARAVEDTARGAMDTVAKPVLDLIGTTEAYERSGRQQAISRDAAERGYGMGAMDPRFRRENPDAAAEYDEIETQRIAGSVLGAGGGVKNVARGIVDAVTSGGAARSASATVRQGLHDLTHDAATDVVMGPAQKKVAASMGNATPGVDLGLRGTTYKLFDDLAPVKELMDAREKVLGRKLADSENGYQILRLGRASREIADEWYTTHVGDSLKNLPNISGNVAQGTADLNTYLRARDAIDKAAAKGTVSGAADSIEVPKGYVRLYRGEGPLVNLGGGSARPEDAGRWYTTSRDYAQTYLDQATAYGTSKTSGRMLFVDVPEDVAMQSIRGSVVGDVLSPNKATEFVLPHEYVKKAQDVNGVAQRSSRKFGGMVADDALQALVELENRLGADKYVELENVAQKFYDLGEFLLDRKVQAGLIDAATAQKLKELYPHHMPIQTIDWLDDKLANTTNRVGKAGGAANDIKELTDFGTERAAELPLEAFRRAADRTAALAAKNEAGAAIVAAARDVDWAHGLIRPADNASAKASGLPTGSPDAFARRPGETLQQFRINGQIVKFWADRSLDPLFNYSVSVGDGPWKNILGASSRAADVTRKLAIGYNPAWGVYQLAMDSLGFLTKNGGLVNPKELGRNVKRLGIAADEVGLSPFTSRAAGAAEGAVAGALAPDVDSETTGMDRLRNAAIGAGVGAGLKSTGLARRANRGALASEARAAGALPGAIDHVSGQSGSYAKPVQKLTGIDINGPRDFVRHATQVLLDGLQGINEKFDAVPRLAEYQARRASGASTQKAALAARDVTIDPSRGGAYTRAINSVVPFFNVAFQGSAYLPRMLRNPETRARAMSGIASSVVMPTLALEAYNRQDPRYADVPDFDKDRGFVIMLPGDGRTDPASGTEQPSYLLIRTGAWTPFVILSRALYDASPAGDGIDGTKLASALTRAASPIDASPVIDAAAEGRDPMRAVNTVAMKYLPAGAKQLVEAGSNYDTFRDRPIVPEGLQNQPAENQFTQDTSELAKLVGGKLGVAPAILDHLLRSWGGGADAIVGAADNVLSVTGIAQAGESQRLQKLRRDLAKTGISEEEAARLQGEIDRELAIKAERDSALRNVPLVGGLGSRYFRESGGQSLEDRAQAVDKALLDKKRDTTPVGSELKRLGKTFGDVKDEIAGVKLTRAMGASYREKALAYREKVLGDLVKSELYRNADDKEKGRLIDGAMQQAAGWAAHEVAEGNPALRARLEDQGAVGSAFIAPQINGNVDVATRRYLGALKAQAELSDLKSNERYRNIAPKDYAETASDVATLQQYKAIMDDIEAETVFQAKFGADRLARAKSARESRFWRSRMDSFRRDNPDYSLFIEAGPRTLTRRGLDAQTVARLAGL